MLTLLDLSEFPLAYSLMERSFPRDEYRPREAQRALLSRENYRIYAHRDADGALLGIAAVHFLSHYLFLEHFAVMPECRSGGIGTAMLAKLRELTGRPVCLEAEPPETEIARRRIAFYERNGFTLHPYPYTMPPLSAETGPVPLRIMTTAALTEADFLCLRDELYTTVYGVK